jgi:hypothetical protein
MMKKRLVYLNVKLLCFLLLSFLSQSVYAEWTMLAKDKRDNTYYLDSAISRSGKIAKAWVLIDFSNPMIDVHSVKRLYEANCEVGRIRIAYKMFYLDKGGVGTVRSTDAKPGFWNYPAPDSISEKLFDKLCGAESDQQQNTPSSEPVEKASH